MWIKILLYVCMSICPSTDLSTMYITLIEWYAAYQGVTIATSRTSRNNWIHTGNSISLDMLIYYFSFSNSYKYLCLLCVMCCSRLFQMTTWSGRWWMLSWRALSLSSVPQACSRTMWSSSIQNSMWQSTLTSSRDRWREQRTVETWCKYCHPLLTVPRLSQLSYQTKQFPNAYGLPQQSNDK